MSTIGIHMFWQSLSGAHNRPVSWFLCQIVPNWLQFYFHLCSCRPLWMQFVVFLRCGSQNRGIVLKSGGHCHWTPVSLPQPMLCNANNVCLCHLIKKNPMLSWCLQSAVDSDSRSPTFSLLIHKMKPFFATQAPRPCSCNAWDFAYFSNILILLSG